MTAQPEEMAWLEGQSGSVEGQRLSLQDGETIIGRGSGCQIQVRDPKVSRVHASIRMEGANYRLKDLNSSQGTFLNGERITSTLLKDGDVIRIGETSIQFCMEQDAIATELGFEPVVLPAGPQVVVPPPAVAPPPAATPAPPAVVPPQMPASYPPTPVEQRSFPTTPLLIGCSGLLAVGVLVVLGYQAIDWFAGGETDGDEAAALAILDEDFEDDPFEAPPTEIPTSEPSSDTSVPTSEVPPTAESLIFTIRPYDEVADASLYGFASYAEWDKSRGSQEHAYYVTTWREGEPAVISLSWCAIDRETLDEHYPNVRFEAELDGTPISMDELTYVFVEDTNLVCHSHKGVVEGLQAGPHILIDARYFDQTVTDGWGEYGPGKDIAEYEIEVLPVISITDTFETKSGNWDETEQTNFNLIHGEGTYTIEIFKEAFMAWSLYDDMTLTDAILLTSARRGSPDQGYYGIIFGYRDVNNFYYYRLRDDGYFDIGKRVEGEFIDIQTETFSDRILQGQELNKLSLIITGGNIQAFVNLEPVATVTDAAYNGGQFGMLASTPLGSSYFQADFDYYSVDVDG